MKGIVLAGGLGTRLYPITRVLNKHILPIYDKPMFFYPLLTLVESGIKDIAVVSGPPHGDQVRQILEYLPVAKNIKVTFVEQPKPVGMSDAIAKCEKFVGKDSAMVIAGDNIYAQNFASEVKGFTKGALSFLRKVKDAQQFGVAVYDVDGNLMGIVEKPTGFTTKWAVSGPHLFDNQVFAMIKNVKFSARGELEITDLDSQYAKLGQLKLIKRSDFWLDMGTFDSLFLASQYIKEDSK